jgi:vancomycin resistance protein YoaR
LQIAMLASTAENAGRLSTYDSEYVTDDGEVLDREALHEESKAVLQDPNEVDTPMTLPSGVAPSDSDADRPSMEDIRAAQESTSGSLDNRFRIERSVSAYTRAEEAQV